MCFQPIHRARRRAIVHARGAAGDLARRLPERPMRLVARRSKEFRHALLMQLPPCRVPGAGAARGPAASTLVNGKPGHLFRSAADNADTDQHSGAERAQREPGPAGDAGPSARQKVPLVRVVDGSLDSCAGAWRPTRGGCKQSVMRVVPPCLLPVPTFMSR